MDVRRCSYKFSWKMFRTDLNSRDRDVIRISRSNRYSRGPFGFPTAIEFER